MNNFKRITQLITLLIVLFFAAPAFAEEITDFSADYTVHTDGTVSVSENIQYDFGGQSRHGIFRTLETKHPQAASTWYKKRSVAINNISVLVDGKTVPAQVTNQGNQIEIKIGDPNITISGTHSYTIAYVLDGALSYGSDGAEFYWNVTGNEWEVPIQNTTATVKDPTGMLLAAFSDCYQGRKGDTVGCTIKETTATSSVFTAGILSTGSGLTIAQQLNADKVAVLVNEELSINWIFYILGLFWLVGLSVWAYRFHTQFKTSQTVVAQYEPYEGILPMYTGVLFDGQLDPGDITAGIIYLAQRGFLKIYKTEKKILGLIKTSDYEFTLLRPIIESDEVHKKLLMIFFPQEATVGETTTLSTLRSNKSATSVLILDTKSTLQKKLENDDFMSSPFVVPTKRQLGILLPMFFLLVVAAFILHLFIIFVVLSAIILIFAFSKRRTEKGYEARNHLLGFKLFLSVTDKERFAFHNAPDKKVELFMEYLPYAIAFKVEKEWAKVFASITIPNPTWYEAGTVGYFSPIDFTNDIQSFASSFSSSSGTSGSSGGGSSGGGGGGGGGGSW